ncbi:Anaphase-promoting complex subunit 10 [Entophlyctis sp. JEL0112]|nr:Anaphase-promoting complex subunit 10 [Entophlyctis sp. JEL0112]
MDLEVHNNQATDLTDPDLDVSRLRNVSAIGAWSVSSHKHGGGFGVESLRDGNLETYWQSDGKQMLDESYCPSKISVRAGSTLQDIQELQLLELEGKNMTGIRLTLLKSPPDGLLSTYETNSPEIPCMLI